MAIASKLSDYETSSGDASNRQTADGTVAVLEWQAWDGFLLRHVLGENAVRIETDPFREFPSAQFDRICESFSTVCFHINLSVRSRLPLGIRELTNRFSANGVHVVNGLVQDVRKSTLHAHLEAIGLASPKATRSGSANEVLFIKTDLNYGGELERLLPRESIAAGGFEQLISPDLGAYRYKTVERKTLPESRWRDPAVVIEKYISNAAHSFYRVYFSGQQIIIVEAFSPGTIKKMRGDPRDTNFVTDLEHLKAGTDNLEISAALKRDVATFVERTPVEFGAIDIVHDGHDNHYIIDLNLTPYAGTRPHDPFLTRFLRLGITDSDMRRTQSVVGSPLAVA